MAAVARTLALLHDGGFIHGSLQSSYMLIKTGTEDLDEPILVSLSTRHFASPCYMQTAIVRVKASFSELASKLSYAQTHHLFCGCTLLLKPKLVEEVTPLRC